MPRELLYLHYGSESFRRTSEQTSDRKVWTPKRALGYLQRRWRSRSGHQKGCWLRGQSGRSVQEHWGLLDGGRNRKYSKVSPELRGSWSPKNAGGIRGRSWKDSEMSSEQKTGRPLTVPRSVVGLLCGGLYLSPWWQCPLLVPWGLGLLCKDVRMSYSSLVFIFGLAPVNHHQWVRFF